MDSIKKPEMLLSLSNTVAIIGSVIYFYKQISSLNAEVEKLTEMLKTSVKKLTALQEKTLTPEQVKEALVPFGQKVEQVHQTSSLVSETCMADLEYLEEALESLIDSLKEQGVEVSLPRKKKGGKRAGKRGGKKPSRKSKGKHHKKDYSESSDSASSDSESAEDEEDVASHIANIRKNRRRHR
jgi:hypothetical protein